jgi:hypothetical protein
MKKLFLLAIIVSFSFFSKAQTTSLSDYQDKWQYYFSQYNSFTAGVSNLSVGGYWEKNKDFKSLKQTVYKYKKGKRLEVPQSNQESSFDNGHLTNYTSYKKGKLNTQYQYKYNADGYYTNYLNFKKGKLIQEESRDYNDSNRVIKYVYYKNNKKKSSSITDYMDYTKIVRQDNYKKDNTEPSYYWAYDYYEDGKKKMSEYYMKNKLKRRYLYTCNDEGKEVKDTVKTSKVCYLTEYNADSSYVKVYRNTDSKGKVRKQRYTYSKDGRLLSYESVNAEGIKSFNYSYEYDDNGNKTNYTYYKKSKLYLQEKFKYNANNKLVEKIRYNDKAELWHRSITKRDSDDRVIETAEFNHKDEITSKTQYQYDEKGNKTKKIVYIKDEIKTEYNYIYDYI